MIAVAVPTQLLTEGSRSDALRIGLTSAAGVGGVVALVVAYRRQLLLEEDREGRRTQRIADAAADRDIERAMHERYQTATAQLGHENITIRLAGVYALAAVGDDWLRRGSRGQAQVCVDVLCSYLRTDTTGEDGLQPDVEVRQTITRVIASHLQSDARPSWSDFDLDFTGSVFAGRHSFDGATFSGEVTFREATFTGQVSFDRVRFASAGTPFDRVRFASGLVSFNEAELTEVSFGEAQFGGGTVSFARATLVGRMSFFRAEFTDGYVDFNRTHFAAELVVFDDARFAGGNVSFGLAILAEGRLSFGRVKSTGGRVSFHGTHFVGAQVSFYDATFEGGEVTFDEAIFRGGKVRFAHVNYPADGGDVVTGPWPGPPAPLPLDYPA